MTTKHGKIALFLACCLFVLCIGSALADGLNIGSQFGYGNTWPNRQTTCGSSGCNTSSCGSACANSSACKKQCAAGKSCSGCTKSGCTSSKNNCPQTTASATARPKTTPSPQATDGHYTIGSSTAQEKEEWNYINQDREKQGLSKLPLDGTLSSLARKKSQDMLTNNYFAHTSPTLGNAATMLRNNGYSFKAVGENIARYGSVAKAHAGLMSSAGHRNNILGANWTRVGVGIALDKNGYVYMTQLFVR